MKSGCLFITFHVSSVSRMLGHKFVMAGVWGLQSVIVYQIFRSGLHGSLAAAVWHTGFTLVILASRTAGPQCLWNIQKPWPSYSDQPLWSAGREPAKRPVRTSERHTFRDFTYTYFLAAVSKVMIWTSRFFLLPYFSFAFFFHIRVANIS